MKIEILKIPESGMHVSGEEPADLLALTDDPLYTELMPVTCELYVQMVDDALIVRGEVTTRVDAQCVRCSQIFSTTVTDSGFLRDYSEIPGVDFVDITEDLREAIILNLPPFPLCDDACKGLCPTCGIDMNQATCDCLVDSKDGAWEALDNLKL